MKTSFLLFRLFLMLLKGISFLFYKKLWCSISGGITISLFCELNNVSWPTHRDSKAVLWSIRLQRRATVYIMLETLDLSKVETYCIFFTPRLIIS